MVSSFPFFIFFLASVNIYTCSHMSLSFGTKSFRLFILLTSKSSISNSSISAITVSVYMEYFSALHQRSFLKFLFYVIILCQALCIKGLVHKRIETKIILFNPQTGYASSLALWDWATNSIQLVIKWGLNFASTLVRFSSSLAFNILSLGSGILLQKHLWSENW